ncbi:MAG: hypothetical protein DMG38_18915 [Acidobacteria bacterium]|nr:MAG: hypothetical protein DMG38_18915 [Acidobacteriota bacterium]
MISPHLGDRVSASLTVASAVGATAALPLGGRSKVDAWNDQLRLLKSKPVGIVGEAENTPFQITPFMFYLTRVADSSSAGPMLTAGADPEKMDNPPKPQMSQEPLPGLPGPDPQKP